MQSPKFFTWVSDDWKTPEDVPEQVRKQINLLWSDGAPVDELADCFSISEEWVRLFLASDTGETVKH